MTTAPRTTRLPAPGTRMLELLPHHPKAGPVGGGPVHQVVLVRHDHRPVTGCAQQLGHGLEGGSQSGVVVGSGIGSDATVGQTAVGSVRFASPEVQSADHQAGRARQRPRRGGGTLRVAVSELHPAVQSLLLALSQNPRGIGKRLGPANTNRARSGAASDIDQ